MISDFVTIRIICPSRYHTLTLPEDEAANCLFVNGSLLHTHSVEVPLSAQVSYYNLGSAKFFTFQFSGFQGEN